MHILCSAQRSMAASAANFGSRIKLDFKTQKRHFRWPKASSTTFWPWLMAELKGDCRSGSRGCLKPLMMCSDTPNTESASKLGLICCRDTSLVTPLNSHYHHPASFSGVSCCTGTHRKLAEFAESCHHTMKLTCTWKHYRSFHQVGPQGGGSTVQDAVHSELTYAEEYGKAILCGAMRQPVQRNCESLFCRDGRSVMCICLLSKAMRIAMQSLKQCTIYAESLDGPFIQITRDILSFVLQVLRNI